MKNHRCIFRIFVAALVIWAAQSNYIAKAAHSKTQNMVEPKQNKTEPFTQQEALEDGLIKAKFKEVELVTLLRLIARKTGNSIIVDGDVKGKVSIEFNGIKPEEAMKSILVIGQLEMVKRGQVFIVRPKKKHMVTRGFTVRHINIMNLSESIKSLFADRATLEVDTNTNTFLVTAPSHVLKEINKLVKQLDVPQKQVMIEAVIMEVSLDDETKLGVNLAAVLNGVSLNAPDLTAQGLGFATDPTTLPDPEGLFGEGDFFLGKSNQSIDVLLEALQTVTDTTVLSHPKVLSVSGQEAQIIVGQKLGFRVTTTSQTGTQETVEFLEVGTQLLFTPIITENNDVIMDIHPEVSDGTISEDGLPNENTTEITSRIRVKNGQTIVLGGLIRERQQKLVKRVPILGSIPFLGVLFRRTVDTINRSEILVFMTPRVIQDDNEEAQTKKEINRIRKLQKQGLKKAPLASQELLSESAGEEEVPLNPDNPEEALPQKEKNL